MINDSSIQLRAPRLLNLSVYLTIIILIVISFVRPPDAAIQGAIIAFCVAMGLVHTLGFRDIRSVRRSLIYFGAQTLLVTALYVVSDMSDAFYFLFFILSVQAMLVLSVRGALVWMVCFFVVGCAGALWSRGADGLISILFNISAYGFIAAYGYTLRQVDATCNQNEQLVGELRNAQQQLHDLAVAEERNRLARDLHDSTKQQAFALSAQLDAVRSLIGRDPSAAERHLHLAEQLADSLRQELAAMILDLRPPALGQQSLPGALRAYAAEWSQHSQIAATVHVEGERTLPLEVERGLLRIAQEALANTARHSQAQTAELRLVYTPERVTLTIHDDGCGFDSHQVTAGLGLHSMQERASLLAQGVLTFHSAPGCGTDVTVACCP